ncbi:MAG: hypothetical protein R6U38_03285 [Desulfatiglandaceae bacterium]
MTAFIIDKLWQCPYKIKRLGDNPSADVEMVKGVDRIDEDILDPVDLNA